MTKFHKRQHAVPASYLAAWTDPATPPGHAPYVHVFSRDGQASKRRSPAKIFAETDLYTIKLPGGIRDLRLEHGLQDGEDAFVRARRDFLTHRKQLPEARLIKLLFFAAAMHARTIKMRDQHRRFWTEVRDTMEEAESNIRKMTPDQRERAVSLPSSNRGPSMGKREVQAAVENTMAFTLPPMVKVEMEFLLLMRSRVLCATANAEFITSDAPVTWYDPDAHRKPPLYRSPSFSDPRLEITFPLSPQQTLLITHVEDYPNLATRRVQTEIEYVDIDDELVTMQNRRTRFGCHKEFVSKQPKTNPRWFERDALPADAWEYSQSIDEVEGE